MAEDAFLHSFNNAQCQFYWFYAGSPPVTRFSNKTVFLITQFILVLSFVHLVLNHFFVYTVFWLHRCFSKVLKNSINRGPSVLECANFTFMNPQIQFTGHFLEVIPFLFNHFFGTSAIQNLSWHLSKRSYIDPSVLWHKRYIYYTECANFIFMNPQIQFT